MGSKNTALNELREYAIEKLEEMKNYSDGINGDEIHQMLFNEDYYIIGYYDAEQWLNNVAGGVFGCIETIKDYENDNFGEVNTDFSSSEAVVNMYVYILGEEILSSVDPNKNYDKDDLQELIDELNGQ